MRPDECTVHLLSRNTESSDGIFHCQPSCCTVVVAIESFFFAFLPPSANVSADVGVYVLL